MQMNGVAPTVVYVEVDITIISILSTNVNNATIRKPGACPSPALKTPYRFPLLRLKAAISELFVVGKPRPPRPHVLYDHGFPIRFAHEGRVSCPTNVSGSTIQVFQRGDHEICSICSKFAAVENIGSVLVFVGRWEKLVQESV